MGQYVNAPGRIYGEKINALLVGYYAKKYGLLVVANGKLKAIF
jgi:hypothetical protein